MAMPNILSDEIGYVLVRKLAEGGMGVVYEAEQRGTDDFRKTVAIKIIREEFSSIKEFRNNVVGEARLVADLIHMNIVQTYHLGEVDGRYFMVMEFVRGINLEEFIQQHRALDIPVPVDLAAFIVSRMCRGLAYAHAKRDGQGRLLGIVHRDVNPRNVLVSFAGDVKVTDFGIAKALDLMYNEEGEVIAGKDEYLSPEQARREVTDARADLFSCGVVLAAHKALARRREDRYQCAADMLTALEIYLYSDRYGPTHEKLSAYLRELFSDGRYKNEFESADTPGVQADPMSVTGRVRT